MLYVEHPKFCTQINEWLNYLYTKFKGLVW